MHRTPTFKRLVQKCQKEKREEEKALRPLYTKKNDPLGQDLLRTIFTLVKIESLANLKSNIQAPPVVLSVFCLIEFPILLARRPREH
jgi:hypothetical protein